MLCNRLQSLLHKNKFKLHKSKTKRETDRRFIILDILHHRFYSRNEKHFASTSLNVGHGNQTSGCHFKGKYSQKKLPRRLLISLRSLVEVNEAYYRPCSWPMKILPFQISFVFSLEGLGDSSSRAHPFDPILAVGHSPGEANRSSRICVWLCTRLS